MVEPSKSAEELHLGALQTQPKGILPYLEAANHRGKASAPSGLSILFLTEASATEEPDEGKLYVRICAGGNG